MPRIIENHIERWVIDTLHSKGFSYLPPDRLDPDVYGSLRTGYHEVLIADHVIQAIHTLNPGLPHNAKQQAFKELQRVVNQGEMLVCNQYFHKLVTEGADVSYMDKGEERTVKAQLIHWGEPDKNIWCVTHQLTVIQDGQHKRPDVIVYLNGIPVIVFELKNATDENATIDKAYQQLKNYHKAIPGLFAYNMLEVISDGLEAKVGTITSDISRFMTWKTADGVSVAPGVINQLSVLMDGLLNKQVLLEMIQSFTVFERYTTEDPITKTLRTGTTKKIAAYHQYYAVKKALDSTTQASVKGGNKKAGVVWHTQGSGKSLSMVFYTGLLVKALDNPTVIVITDRNDLDDQLFETFANCSQLLRQTPLQIESREQLVKELRNRNSGGIFFSTIQKFFPESGADSFPQLSNRSNIIVIADEAHRTQYGFDAKVRYLKDDAGNEVGSEIAYGFAKHMHDALPSASFIGFTGTPVEGTDRNTKAVFGDYIDIYDIERAVNDGATKPIYYENRFVKLKLDNLYAEGLEEQLSIVSENIPENIVNKAIDGATRQESIVGHPDRLTIIANDIVTHFEDREKVFSGKALIVAMSRRIAVALYNQITALRPEWHNNRDEEGVVKVIITGSSSDDDFLSSHIRSKGGRTMIAGRLKDENDPLKLVIVVDMWLTGFDAPVLHTMYLDKDMSGHNLMQAIARVNRVFKDKPGGLVVDYVPVTSHLKEALKLYTESGGKGKPVLNIEEAVWLMLAKLETVQQMMYGYAYKDYFTAPINRKLNILLEAEEHILQLDNGKERFLQEVSSLSKAYVLAKSEKTAAVVAEEIAFFQAVRARLAKYDLQVSGQRKKEFESTIRSLVETAVATDGLINLMEEAGLHKPTLSIFSEEFMDDIRKMKQKNVAIELLKKLLNDQIKLRFKKNVVQNKSFTERLQVAINKYNSKSISAVEMMEILLEITHDVDEETKKGNDLGLTDTEKAFYDALSMNRSAVEMMGDEKLLVIAKELVERVRRSTTIDWTIRQSAKDRVKLEVKRVLRYYHYPPDDEKRATDTVLEQAEMHAGELV